jgi:hypothetical protein
MEEFEVGGNGKKVRVGSLLSPEIKESLVAFLRNNTDVFAWCHDDMPGIDPSVISHRLNVDPNHWPVKQKEDALLQKETKPYMKKWRGY